MNKLVNRILLLLSVILVAVGQGFAMDSWIDHKSSTAPNKVGNCYQIKSAGDLAWYANFVNAQGEHAESCAELKSDIDLSGNFWVPISFKGKRHKVNFNGNGYIIRNLYISAEELLNKYTDTQVAQNLGLIGAFEGHVQNVILENVEVYGYGKNYTTGGADPVKNPLSIGTVVGWQTTDGSIVENCYVTGKMVTSGDGQAVGGIVGNNGGGTIRNCYSAVNIDASGTSYVGGIAGYTKAYQNGSATISSCVYDGELLSSTGAGEAGAIVGNHLDGTTTFENCYYDETKFDKGVGETMGGTTTGSTTGTPDLNSEVIISTLNNGSTEGIWSSGETSISLNGYGADGYKITFNANGGSFAGGTTFIKYVQHGNIINNDGVADPAWATEDFVFAGWAGDAYMTPASKAVTISAVWNPVYTITFDAAPGTFPNEAPGVVKTVKVERGKKIAVKDFVIPSYYMDQGVKYSFMGWSTKENPAEEDALVDERGVDNLPNATGNITLHAVWTEATIYTVTFDANGHGPSIANYVKVKNVYDHEKATALTDDDFEHADGYSLDTENGSGWCIDSECSAEFDFNTLIEGNRTLYAKWKKDEYAITYENLEGASNSNPATYTVDGLVLADLSRGEAHRFLGWYKDPEFTNKVTSIPAGSTGVLTLYAKWEDVSYTITYRAGSGNAAGLIPSEKKIHGEEYTLRDASYTRKGYTQSGWTTTDCGEKVLDFGAIYQENKDTIFYPSWDIAHYTITYVCEGCTDVNNPTSYTMFDDADLKFATPIYPGNNQYKWYGWYKDAALTQPIQQIAKGSVGDTIIYGKLLKYYNITYVLNKKNVKANNAVRYHVENTIELKAPNPASIDGYTFAGWYDNEEFTGEPVTEIAKGTTGDRIFYAKWEFVPVVTQSGAVTITEYEDGTKSAVINGAYTGEGAIDFPTDVTVSSVVLNRNFVENTMSTLMLPFSIDVSKVNGGKIYRFKRVDVNEETGIWKVVVGRIYTDQVGANTPYLVLPSAEKMTFEGPVTFNTTTTPLENAYGLEEGSSWEYKGVYAHTDFDEVQEDGPMYAFAGQAKNGVKVGQFKKIGAGVKAYPMQAYLVNHDGSALAKSASGSLGHSAVLPDVIDIEVEDENGIVVETGKLNTVTGEVRMDRWFDLKGRKLNSRPSVKGTYYKNGKKVIIK